MISSTSLTFGMTILAHRPQVLHPHEILGAELIEVQHKWQSSDAGRDRGKNNLRSNWESLFSKPNKKFVVVMHVLTVPSVMEPEAGVSSYQEFEISSFRDANGTILPDKQHLEQACACVLLCSYSPSLSSFSFFPVLILLPPFPHPPALQVA